MKINKLENVLLGLINMHDGVSGYELKKIISISTSYFFKASFSQIYPALARLTEYGLVTFVEPEESGHQKKRYSLTDDGRLALQQWLREPIEYAFSEASIWELILKLSFMGSLELAEVEKTLLAARQHFDCERADLVKRRLDAEQSFMVSDLAQRDVILELWSCEYTYIVEAAEHKVAWLDRCLEVVRKMQS